MAKKLQVVSCKPFQSDWNVTDESSVAYIRNKPDLSSFVNVKNVILYSSSWSGEGPYTQSISIGATANSKIDIQPKVEFINSSYKLTAKNDNGSVTVYAVGEKPSLDISVQVTITEVSKENELDIIWGNLV